VVLQAGQSCDKGIGEPRPQLAGWPILERAEVDVQPDDGKVGVQAGPDEYCFVQYQH
jgi:hypothetical protein